MAEVNEAPPRDELGLCEECSDPIFTDQEYIVSPDGDVGVHQECADEAMWQKGLV